MKIPIPDSVQPFEKHQMWNGGNHVILPDGTEGYVTGFAVDENGSITDYARINDRLYHVSALKRAR